MAYADQQMSGNRITAIVVVVLIHVAVGYVLVTGLAYDAYKKVIAHVATVDVKEPDKKPPPPPPPQKNLPPPPIVAPPPPINVATAPPQIQVVNTPPPPAPVLAPVAAPVAPPPAAPKYSAKRAVPRGNPADWVTTDDYPASDLRAQHAGSTGISVTVGTDGRVTSCEVTSSSGFPGLDAAACSNVSRRGRFTPAIDGNTGQPTTGSYSQRVKWVIPADE